MPEIAARLRPELQAGRGAAYPQPPKAAINPMTGVVEGFRWALLGTASAPGPMLLVSSLVSVLLLIGGALYFRRMERDFADLV